MIWLTYALRNLRSGLKGFWIFLTCLTLGVASIAIIGSLGAAVDRGLTEQGQPLMGGDVEFSIIQRPATDKELSYITSKGIVSEVTTLRAMATSSGQSTLVEIKATDENYPLYGALTFEQTVTENIYDAKNNEFGVAADPLLLGRLGLKIGDTLKIGTTQLRLRATIKAEPDRISDGIVFGPRLIMSHAALKSTGLIQPGSLITWKYRVKLADDTSLNAAKTLVDDANTKFPDSGWRVRARDQAAGGAERFVERLQYFMTLVSIAALTIGGAGIANAVAAFVNRRLGTIATLKCLGISNRNVFGMFLTEILLVGLIGITIGLAVGAVSPWVLSAVAGHLIPVPVSTRIEWQPLAFAGILGLIVTTAFAIWPLARISRVSGAALFRSSIMRTDGRPNWRYLAASLALLGLACIIILLSFDNMRITAMYLGGLIGSFVILALLAWAIIKLASLLPRPKNTLWRHAVMSLYRPGSSSLAVIMALGLGLTLFVTLALTDQTISRELRSGIPDKAPAFFFLDVRNDELPQFKIAALAEKGVTNINNAPMMRGRIVKVKDIPSDKVEATPNHNGRCAVTAGSLMPHDSRKVQNSPKANGGMQTMQARHSSPWSMKSPMASASRSVTGSPSMYWAATSRRPSPICVRSTGVSMGINFVMVFNPKALQAAPHSHLVTVEMNDGDEAVFLNHMAASYPSATAVRVKDALATVSDLLGKMLGAVRGANALTLLTGVLVLSGALAAGLSTRSYEAVVLKTYGATRRQLLTTFVIEYGLLGLVSALFGIIVGSIGAWYLATFILELPWVFSFPLAATTAILAMVLTIGAGLITTARALSVKPSGYLRNE